MSERKFADFDPNSEARGPTAADTGIMRGKLGISAFGAGGPSARAAHRGVFGNSIGNFLAVPFAVEGDAKPDFRLANLREGTKEMNFPHPASESRGDVRRSRRGGAAEPVSHPLRRGAAVITTGSTA